MSAFARADNPRYLMITDLFLGKDDWCRTRLPMLRSSGPVTWKSAQQRRGTANKALLPSEGKPTIGDHRLTRRLVSRKVKRHPRFRSLEEPVINREVWAGRLGATSGFVCAYPHRFQVLFASGCSGRSSIGVYGPSAAISLLLHHARRDHSRRPIPRAGTQWPPEYIYPPSQEWKVARSKPPPLRQRRAMGEWISH
jgi:hypothetical protein